MKKKSESDEARKRRRTASPAKAARVIPSRIWAQGARAIWGSLAWRERIMLLMGVLVPVLDQVSRLGSLGVTMRAVSHGIREPLTLEQRLWLGLIILGATVITVFIQMFARWVKNDLRAQNTRMIRRAYGDLVAVAARFPLGEREEQVKHLISEEKSFLNSATSGVSAVIEFWAAIVIVLVLLAILTWFDWIVGAILLIAGVVSLMVLKRRVKASPPTEEEDEKLTEARKAVSAKLESIGGRRTNPEELIQDYADNEYDQLSRAESDEKKQLQRKISSAMNFGSAILMTLVFFLVSGEGAIDENKMVWMIVFILGLRMVTSFGKMAMVSWGSILSEKNSLMLLAKAGLAAQARAGEGGNEVDDDDPVGDEAANPYGSTGVKIVDYTFSGLNGPEIVSREPLVVEMTVESEVEIEGFYWSFAITLEQGSPYLMSKTSQDYGIKWNLPKGRNRFRMVSGPVWLPARTYSIMVGAAEGKRLLDLVGFDGEPVSIIVLPDETAKRSVQTRVACDVVVVDVEWEREFRQEKSEIKQSQAETPFTY